MELSVHSTTREMAGMAAAHVAGAIMGSINVYGSARILLSTGASQLEMFEELVKWHQDVDWSKVTMFHLDEYVGLPETHPASFRRYLKERFTSHVPLKEAVFVNGEGDVEAEIAELTRRVQEAPIDLGVIGIGENGHIAFNDPPADFETDAAYAVVTLDERCRRQQVGEGWFKTVEDVPERAISMTVRQILKCRSIVSIVPHAVKADAVRRALMEPVNPQTPATALKTHHLWTLYLDAESAAPFANLDGKL